jgi:Tol biopolymer transport system component
MAEQKSFSSEDIILFRQIQDFAVSPTGAEVAVVLRSIDQQQDQYQSKIWLASVEGKKVEPYTHGPGHDYYPRWSPNGEILAFVSDRNNGQSQIFLLPRSGGEAKQLTQMSESVSSVEWSFDGKSLIVTASVDREKAPPGEENSSAWQKRPYVITKERYKSDNSGFILRSNTHAFVVDCETGAAQQITSGDYDVSSPVFLPNHSQIVYVRSADGPKNAHIKEVWISSLDGKKQPRKLSDGISSASAPSSSPDGRYIAFIGSAEEGASIQNLYVIDLELGTCKLLGGDRVEIPSFPLGQMSPPVWQEDCRHILIPLAERGQSQLARIDRTDGSI